jgi:hypothetical protein
MRPREQQFDARPQDDVHSSDRMDDRFARQSFTFRRMRSWQVGAMTVVAALLFGLALFGWMI